MRRLFFRNSYVDASLMKRVTIVVIAILFVSSGCAWFKTQEEKSANELITEGMEDFEDGKYKKAVESFQKLKDWYPFSKYAILAELKVADAHFYEEQYEEAIFSYEEFETLHPRNEAIPYVIYQIGRCYFKQVDTIDRDQSNTQKALDTFNRLIKTYPDNEYSKKALAHRTKCQKLMAGHDMYVGKYYYKGKHYKAALHRFKSVLSTYPDVGVHHQALHYIAACEKTMQEEEAKGRPKEGSPEKKPPLWKVIKFW